MRISCDAALTGIIADVSRVVGALHPSGGVFHVTARGVVVVSADWKHWPCLFPQRDVVRAHPADFLRGLFHSEGCRVDDWATRMVGGEKRR